ncbi:MAG: hypothetical protein J6Y08_00540 [Clostridiales bacterium]|nr:hypothetical protein [Clostridiales bacterium]
MNQNRVHNCVRRMGLLMLLCAVMGLLASCHDYDGDTVESGKFTLRTNEQNTYATVLSWNWSGDPNDVVIDIPDTYNDSIVIDAMGGPTGSNAPLLHFRVVTDCDVKYKGDDPEAYDMEVSFDEVVFTLKIGKNIERQYIFYANVSSDVYDYIAIENDDGSVTFYKVYFEVEVSKDNEKFYSKNGKLYAVKNDELIKLPYLED